jgi:intracellular multiplication protein IcmO
MVMYVEEHHYAKDASRVVDVRPAGTKYAEWLSKKYNLLTVVIPMLMIAAGVPSISIFLFFAIIIHMLVHVVTKPKLPYRYPAGNKTKYQGNKRGTGIMLFGNVTSKSEYEQFKEIWQGDDDLRKHMLIIGSTGSGKSESLKGIFFNSLCWSSGFFVADGKADNKLPTDTFTMVRSFGRDDDLLFLNFLLGGKTPEQVRKSRRRRTNKINPVSSADADTIIQMGANMLPKAEGEGKAWQEKALNLWRSVIQALCYIRDTDIDGRERIDLSISTIIDFLALPKIEELYLIGHEEARTTGEWSYGLSGIKAYLESGCPGYKIDKLLAKHGLTGDAPAPAPAGRAPAGKSNTEQDGAAFEQHAYRTGQLMPVLNLLDKTYGYIFKDKFPEIDMLDVTLNNRILVMLIPSLEKSAQEAENLGKLAIACLRVMMGKNLGSEIEGVRAELIDSKATASPYPYVIALDELAYYFSDGIAVMFAQARSLGFCMIAAAQDLEKLTEGTRSAEAGAMFANQVSKWFMRIDDANKTYEFINKILGKVKVTMRRTYELGDIGYKKTKDIDVQEIDRFSLEEFQEKGAGEAVYNSAGRSVRAKSFYVAHDLAAHANNDFYVLRFLQVEPPSINDIAANSMSLNEEKDKHLKGFDLLSLLRYQKEMPDSELVSNLMISSVSEAAKTISPYAKAVERGIALYEAAKIGVLALEAAHQQVRFAGADDDSNREANPQDHGDELENVNDPAFDGGLYQRPISDEDDEGVDPLAFLGGPFERKPAEVLLQKNQRNPGRGNPADLMTDFYESPVLKLLATGRHLSLRKDAAEAEAAMAEAAAMRVLTRMDVKESDDDADWVGNAVVAAKEVLELKSMEGKTVVGFSSHTSEKVTRIESLLGSPEPTFAASRLEAVVSNQITPDVGVDPQSAFDTEDIEGFFDTLGMTAQKT